MVAGQDEMTAHVYCSGLRVTEDVALPKSQPRGLCASEQLVELKSEEELLDVSVPSVSPQLLEQAMVTLFSLSGKLQSLLCALCILGTSFWLWTSTSLATESLFLRWCTSCLPILSTACSRCKTMRTRAKTCCTTARATTKSVGEGGWSNAGVGGWEWVL